MKKLSGGRAVLVAFVVSSASLFATLTSAVVFGKHSRRGESENVNFEIVSQGHQIFMEHCAECHGSDARGYEGTDLHNLHGGDRLLRQIIRGGIKGEMPAYARVLSDSDVRALINYLRALKN